MTDKELLSLYFSEFKKSFAEEANNFHASIRRSSGDSSASSFNTIFAGISLYCNVNNEQIRHSITDWIDDYSIDAIYLPTEHDTDNNISVFDFKNNNLTYEDIKKFIDYVESYILDGNDLPRKWNPQLIQRLKDFHEYREKNPDRKIDLVIYRENAEMNKNKIGDEENRLLYLKNKYELIWNIKVITKSEILDFLMQKLWYEWNIYSKWFKDFLLKYDKYSIIKLGNEWLISAIWLLDILFFVHGIAVQNSKMSPNRIYDVFKLNVRKLTKKSGNIRNNIVETLKTNPDKFVNYHNWITITCENYFILDETIRLIQPQIVNWCQTIAGLYDRFKEKLNEYVNIVNWFSTTLKNKDEIASCICEIEKLKRAKIVIKIVIAEPLSDEPKNISKYANSQTEVSPKELIVNNIEQLIISNYLRLNGFNYFRKEWQVIERSKSVVSMDQIYKFMYSYLYLDPSKWKNDLNTVLFRDDTLYKKLFPGFFSLEDILKMGKFYKKVLEFRRKHKDVSKYYDDFIVFGLFIAYKEGWIQTEIKPSTISNFLDEFVFSKGLKKNDFFMLFQKDSKELINYLIEKIESKYEFTVDRDKFWTYRKDFIEIERRIRSERMDKSDRKPIIFYNGNIFRKVTDYLIEKNENWKKIKNFIYILIDIVSDLDGIALNDLNEVLKIFYSHCWKKRESFISDIQDSLSNHPDKIFIREDKIYLYKNISWKNDE